MSKTRKNRAENETLPPRRVNPKNIIAARIALTKKRRQKKIVTKKRKENVKRAREVRMNLRQNNDHDNRNEDDNNQQAEANIPHSYRITPAAQEAIRQRAEDEATARRNARNAAAAAARRLGPRRNTPQANGSRQSTRSPPPSNGSRQSTRSPPSVNSPRQSTRIPPPSNGSRQSTRSPPSVNSPRQSTRIPPPSNGSRQSTRSPPPINSPRQSTRSPLPASRSPTGHHGIYCGNNQHIPHRGTRAACYRKGRGIGLHLPVDPNYDEDNFDYDPIDDRDIYCGNDDQHVLAPNQIMGRLNWCLSKGIGIGKRIRANA